jgi:L-fuculose-phosphate aldolase
MSDLALRKAIVATVARLDAAGLNRGSTGNVSARSSDGRGFWITPTGMGAEGLKPQDLAWVSLADGAEEARFKGRWLPSSEWAFHQAIYQRRPDHAAVIHVHSVHATALACLRRPLPAFHYMVAVAGGIDVPCIDYHLFGTPQLSAAVSAALTDRHACLMANHGVTAAGRDLRHAWKVVVEVEALCDSYLRALAVGEPALLSASEMAEVIERFKHYGQARRTDAV